MTAPAVLLFESSVVSAACSPGTSEAEVSGRALPRSPSGTRPPVAWGLGFAPEPPLPDGAECPGGRPLTAPFRDFSKAGGTVPGGKDGKEPLRDGEAPPVLEEVVFLGAFGFG